MKPLAVGDRLGGIVSFLEPESREPAPHQSRTTANQQDAMRAMLATSSLLDATTIDSAIRFVVHSPHMSSVVGGIGLGYLFYLLPRFRKEIAQTIGIGALTAGYLLDSASHIVLSGSAIGVLGVAAVALLAGGSALATYAGLEWAGNHRRRKSTYTTVTVAGFGALPFGSHSYIAARAWLGTVYASASLFGTGLLGLAEKLGRMAVAACTLYKEMTTLVRDPSNSERTESVVGQTGSPGSQRTGRGAADLFGFDRINRKVIRGHAKAA